MSKRSLLILAALAVFSEPAWAQTPAGGPFLVNTYTTGAHFGGPVSAAPNGDFVIVWTSGGTGGGPAQDGSVGGVFGQRFDTSGSAQGSEFQVNTYTTGEQVNPSVAVDGRGNFVVVWMSYGQDGSGPGIFAQRYDASGATRGQEFRVNTFTTGAQSAHKVAADLAGNFVVVWATAQDGSDSGIFGQRYDAAGAPRGGEFQINSYTPGSQSGPDVDADPAGNFVVTWFSAGQDGSGFGIFARRFDSSGAPQGAEFAINAYTLGNQTSGRITLDGQGNFVVSWSGFGAGDGDGVFARRFDSSGVPLGPDARVNTTTHNPQYLVDLDADSTGNFTVIWQSFSPSFSGWDVFGQRYRASGAPLGSEFLVPSYIPGDEFGSGVALDAVGNIVAVWAGDLDPITWGVLAQRYGGLFPAALAVDGAGNHVFEPGETVTVSPSWRNRNGTSQAFVGAASNFTGPGGPSNPAYLIPDDDGDYGSVANATTASCAATGNCYSMETTLPTSRPLAHWDAAFQEDILPVAQGQSKTWALHVGDSFTDVPRSNASYRFIETVLHRGVVTPCSTNGATAEYCPGANFTREAIAMSVLIAREGAGYVPPPCVGSRFADVPSTSPFCPFIQEIVRRRVMTGCGGLRFCPGDPVTREQLSIVLLRTLDPALEPPACTTPMFGDVRASSRFCRWIEELARRGIVNGCGGGNYCPTGTVSREQMAVSISVTFGLTLYGP